MSVLSGTLGAVFQRDSAREAESSNRRQARLDRELQLQLFHEGRGSTGHALLPEYGGDFEKNLFGDTRAAYEANRRRLGTPAEELAQYDVDVERFRPAFEGGNRFIDDIYSGALLNQQMAEAQPVMEARTALARTQKQGILDDITQRLGALDAANARKGFVGSGTGAQAAAFRQTAPLYQQAAGVGAAANLANAQERQGIANSTRQTQLSSLGLPAARAQQAVNLRQLPGSALTQSQLTAQKPFGVFSINPNAARIDPFPQVQPLPSNAGIAAAGIGSVTGGLGSYLAQRQQAKALSQMGGGSGAYNPYGTGAGLDPNLYSQPYNYGEGAAAIGGIAAAGDYDWLSTMYE